MANQSFIHDVEGGAKLLGEAAHGMLTDIKLIIFDGKRIEWHGVLLMTKSHKQKACGLRVPFARPRFQAHLQPFGQTGVNSDMFLKHTPSKECFGDGPSLIQLMTIAAS